LTVSDLGRVSTEALLAKVEVLTGIFEKELKEHKIRDTGCRRRDSKTPRVPDIQKNRSTLLTDRGLTCLDSKFV